MMDGGETAAPLPGESDADTASATAKKSWQTPKVARLDGKKGPQFEPGILSDGLAEASTS
jgi:hypothetical protein